MYEILALAYEFAAEFVPFFLTLLLLRRKRGRFAQPLPKGAWLGPAVFALYVMAVFYVTNPGTVYDAVNVDLADVGRRVNCIPFSQRIDVVGYGLNVVMFLPFGFLAPLIWEDLGKLHRVALRGLAFSALIEVSQLLSYRGTDVDDLIMNTLGAVIGYLAYRVWDKVMGSRFRVKGLPAGELTVFVLAIFLGRFLLFYRMGLIRLIYGY